MSQKSPETEKRKPRAMPVETILTRFKTAQQKLDKEKLKASPKPKSVKKTPVKHKTVEKKSPKPKKVFKPIDEVKKIKNNDNKNGSKEYYPNKLKRKVLNARRFLAPKHNFKVICGTKSKSKRKLHIPQKGSQYTDEQTTKQSEISIIDMVRIIEESDSLDDEDLLEILTCPSPVWWEEPPDGYIEEALFSQPGPKVKQMSVKNQLLEEELKRANKVSEASNKNIEEINVSDSLEINIENKDKNFINKRCNLENLLGGIKNKTKQESKNNKISEVILLNEKKDDKESEKAYFERNVNKSNKSMGESDYNDKSMPNLDTNDGLTRKSETTIMQRNPNITEHNQTKSEKSLSENKDKSIDVKIKVKNKDTLNSSKDDIIIIEHENNVQFNNHVTKKNTNCTVLVTNKKNRNSKSIENKRKSNENSDSDIEIIEDSSEARQKRDSYCTDEDLVEFHDDEELQHLENLDIPIEGVTDLEKNKKSTEVNNVFFRRDSVLSDASSKAMTEEYLDLSILDDDEKNDTNDRTNVENSHENVNTEECNEIENKISKEDFFNNLGLSFNRKKSSQNKNEISENRVKVTKVKDTVTKNVINANLNKSIENKTKSDDSKEYVTIYKIVDNENETEQTKKKIPDKNVKEKVRNINTYYKCKKVCKTDEKIDSKFENKKNESIIISETDKIKYCYKCSSIFDSENCNYCIRKNLKRKLPKSDFACDQCGLSFVTKQNIIKHLIEHNVENIDKL